MTELKTLRQQLDEIDQQILQALANRFALLRRIGVAKREQNVRVRDRIREQQLLQKIIALGKKIGVDVDLVQQIYQQILAYSVRIQQEDLTKENDPKRNAQRIRVAYQGTEGSYSYLATKSHFASRDCQLELIGMPSFSDAIDAVSRSVVDYAMLPIENTTAGSINAVYDLLGPFHLFIVGEEIRKIDHCLMATKQVPVNEIRRILSQGPALEQCRKFLDKLADVRVEAYRDTAEAAKAIRELGDPSIAAIASEEAAAIFELEIIKRNICDQQDNFTRFVLIAREPVEYDARIACKTSLVLATKHKQGALLQCLAVFARYQLNLSKLESRPRPGVPWEYLFYVDFEGNVSDPKTEEALSEIARHTSLLKVLGSYPTRNTPEGLPVRIES